MTVPVQSVRLTRRLPTVVRQTPVARETLVFCLGKPRLELSQQECGQAPLGLERAFARSMVAADERRDRLCCGGLSLAPRTSELRACRQPAQHAGAVPLDAAASDAHRKPIQRPCRAKPAEPCRPRPQPALLPAAASSNESIAATSLSRSSFRHCPVAPRTTIQTSRPLDARSRKAYVSVCPKGEIGTLSTPLSDSPERVMMRSISTAAGTAIARPDPVGAPRTSW